MKLTFKKQAPATGLARVTLPEPDTYIKLDGKIVGSIFAPHYTDPDRRWRIRLMVEKTNELNDGNPNCTWMSVILKARFNDEQRARSFFREKLEQIQRTYRLHQLED